MRGTASPRVLTSQMPRCWDGKNLDATDHASHMAYPTDRVDGRKCPPSHPKLLPQIFFVRRRTRIWLTA